MSKSQVGHVKYSLLHIFSIGEGVSYFLWLQSSNATFLHMLHFIRSTFIFTHSKIPHLFDFVPLWNFLLVLKQRFAPCSFLWCKAFLSAAYDLINWCIFLCNCFLECQHLFIVFFLNSLKVVLISSDNGLYIFRLGGWGWLSGTAAF